VDNGIGIPKQYTRKVFQPFFRIPAGNLYNASGHGLGLSLVKQVAVLHGGDISVKSTEQGTTFYLKLNIS
jgi:signal transduction histidine kinase